MNRWAWFITVILIGAFAVAGCLGGDGNPVVPLPEDAVMSGSTNQTGQTQTHLWGYYDVVIDIESQTVEAVLNRNIMFAANVVSFMNGNPAAMVFTINDTPVGPDYVDVDIDVGLLHPLPDMAEYNGYDVRGIFIADGSGSLAYDSNLGYAQLGTDQYMFNADGYTRWWNPGEFTTPGVLGYTHGDLAAAGFSGDAELNPYKYFADGLGATGDLFTYINANADDNGVFTSGTTNTRNYLLRFPNAKSITYGYAIVANWEGELPEHHPSNAVESQGINATVTPDIYWVDAGDNGGNLILDIDVQGWNYQPSVIYIESEVLGTTAYAFTTEMIPVTGTDVYSTYQCDIPTTNVTSSADSEFWVICEYDADYTNTFGVNNGASTDLLVAFFRYDLEILNQCPCALTVSNPVDDFSATIYNTDAGTYTVTADVTGTIDEPFTAEFTGTTSPVPTVVNVTYNSGTGQISINGISFDGAAVGGYDLEVSNNCGAADTVIADISVEGCPTSTGSVSTNTIPSPIYAGDDTLYSIVIDETGDTWVETTTAQWTGPGHPTGTLIVNSVAGTITCSTVSFASASAGAYAIEVTNGCGQSADLLTGTAAACPVPMIDAPPNGVSGLETGNQAEQGNSYSTAVIHGTNFFGTITSGDIVITGTGTVPTVTYSSHTATTINCTIDCTSASIGWFNITVTNGCGEDTGTSGNSAFEVISGFDPDIYTYWAPTDGSGGAEDLSLACSSHATRQWGYVSNAGDGLSAWDENSNPSSYVNDYCTILQTPDMTIPASGISEIHLEIDHRFDTGTDFFSTYSAAFLLLSTDGGSTWITTRPTNYWTYSSGFNFNSDNTVNAKGCSTPACCSHGPTSSSGWTNLCWESQFNTWQTSNFTLASSQWGQDIRIGLTWKSCFFGGSQFGYQVRGIKVTAVQ